MFLGFSHSYRNGSKGLAPLEITIDSGERRNLIRTSIHDEYDLMLSWHIFVYLAGVNEFKIDDCPISILRYTKIVFIMNTRRD